MDLSAIVVPRGRLPQKFPKEGQQPPGVRRMASTSNPPQRDIFEIGPRSKSRNSLDLDLQPQSSTYSGRSGFAWPFNKSENPETTSKVSLDGRSSTSSHSGSEASKFRVVGRGGSGSKLRQVSLSSPIVVLEADSPSLRQPLNQGAGFYRPSGRGGLGSLSTSPPTVRAMKPLKSPTAIMALLRRRKRNELHKDEQSQSHNSSLSRRSQSVYYRSRQIQEHVTDSGYLDERSQVASGNSSFEGPSTSISQIHPDYDTNSIIEEVTRRKSHEHHERSIDKLTRTLGAHPLMEDRHTTKNPIFDNFSTTDERLVEWDSYESDTLESEILSGPITFAPASTENVSRSKRTHTRHTRVNIDSSVTTTSSTREDNSVQSESDPFSSHMPHLHVSTHTDAVSAAPYDDESLDLNEPVTKSDWLVPLNEVVISIRRSSPSKPQSWTGQWNREMKDVIRDLRRL